MFMISSAKKLYLVFLYLCLLADRGNHGFVTAQAPFVCDFGPDVLSNMFRKSIPHNCIDVPYDDGSMTTVQERCYYTYVPASCTSDENDNSSKSQMMNRKVPLVFDIHGEDSCPLFMAMFSGWMRKAEEECFVVVWPSGTEAVPENKLFENCFNLPGFLQSDDYANDDGIGMQTTPCCCYSYIEEDNDNEEPITNEPNDILFLKMAIDAVVESFDENSEEENSDSSVSIDRNRVYMAGWSNGCMASLAMAALHSDTIAAVCCHAGTVITPFPDDYRPVPIWMAFGMEDPIVPYEGLTIYQDPDTSETFGFWKAGQTMDYLSYRNGCSKEPDEIDLVDGAEVLGTILRRNDCQGNANTEFVTLFEAGHFFYNGGSSLSLAPTTWDTTTMAWEFCSSHVLGPKQETGEHSSSAVSAVRTAISRNAQGVLLSCLLILFLGVP